MAIKFGMKLPEIFAQLVRGYRKVTGRNPEGLDLIKIRQESLRRFQDMNKVVDMQTGKSIDASKPIVGGSQEFASGIMKAMKTKPREVKTEDTIKKKLEKQNKESIKKIKERKFEDAVKAEDSKVYVDNLYVQSIDGHIKGAEILGVIKSSETEKEYLDYFYRHVIDETMDRLQDYFKANQWHIANSWYQQYWDGAHHVFHNHEKCNWANVYFLELPSSKDVTQIKIRDK